jgi:hypothetical protein
MTHAKIVLNKIIPLLKKIGIVCSRYNFMCKKTTKAWNTEDIICIAFVRMLALVL